MAITPGGFEVGGVDESEAFVERIAMFFAPLLLLADIPGDDFHHMLCDANLRLINNYYKKQFQTVYHKADDLYHGGLTNFRGFRPI